MASKLLTAKSWTDAIKGSAVDGDDFEKALTKYESLVKKKGKPDELLKTLDSIGKLAGELKGQVTKISKAKKYIADVSDALKAEKLEVTKANAGPDTIGVSFRNNSGTDILLWVEDLNAPPTPKELRVPLEWVRLNNKKSVYADLFADQRGEGQVRWKGKATDSAYDVNGEVEKGVKDGKTIDVNPM